MNTRTLTKDSAMGRYFIVSAVIHLTVFLLLVWYGGYSAPLKIQETYYVDVVNLPVASPRAGSPSQKGNDTQPAPAPPAPPVMALPKPAAAAAKPQTIKPPDKPVKAKDSAAESSSEFESKLKRMDEARQQEARMARLQERFKAQGSGRAGMPAASGSETGSSYEAYIKSRLKDAFRETISFNSKTPKMVVRLFIDSNGRLSRKKTESSSGDTAFELSVLRAIDMASEKFPPHPTTRCLRSVLSSRTRELHQISTK